MIKKPKIIQNVNLKEIQQMNRANSTVPSEVSADSTNNASLSQSERHTSVGTKTDAFHGKD